MKKLLTLLVAALSLSTVSAYANPQGFNQGYSYQQGYSSVPGGFQNNNPNTVRGVLNNAYDDQHVVLRGSLTDYIREDIYEFTDLNGDRIRVELDDDYNWGGISKGQLIDIHGEVDKDLFSTIIDVKWATPVVNQAPAQIQ